MKTKQKNSKSGKQSAPFTSEGKFEVWRIVEKRAGDRTRRKIKVFVEDSETRKKLEKNTKNRNRHPELEIEIEKIGIFTLEELAILENELSKIKNPFGGQ